MCNVYSFELLGNLWDSYIINTITSYFSNLYLFTLILIDFYFLLLFLLDFLSSVFARYDILKCVCFV